MTGWLQSIEIAAWLSAAYGIALVLAAHGIDRLAKRVHGPCTTRTRPPASPT